MSRNKRGSTANELYSAHLRGTGLESAYMQTPEAGRQALMERMYVRILTELATNRFKWSGMPSSIDVRFMELCLFYHGLSVFFYDKNYSEFFAMRGGGNGPMNMLENPTSYNVVGNMYMTKTISAVKESYQHGIAVPIWANYLRAPDLDIVTVYARKLARIDMTIEINSDNARRSKVITVADNVRLSAENFDRQITEGSNGIRVNGGGMQSLSDTISAIDLGVDPDTIVNLHILRTRLWNECMGLLGIENANQDKKERLVAAEVDANNDQTSMTRYINLNERRHAIERIQRAYPNQLPNLAVEYYTDEERTPALMPSPDDMAGQITVPPEWSAAQ